MGDVFVVLAGGDPVELLGAGIELARSRRTGVSFVGIAPALRAGWCWPAPCPPFRPNDFRQANVAGARGACLDLIRRMAPDVRGDYRVLCGTPGRTVGALIVEGQFGAIVLDWSLSRRRPIRRALRRREETLKVVPAVGRFQNSAQIFNKSWVTIAEET